MFVFSLISAILSDPALIKMSFGALEEIPGFFWPCSWLGIGICLNSPCPGWGLWYTSTGQRPGHGALPSDWGDGCCPPSPTACGWTESALGAKSPFLTPGLFLRGVGVRSSLALCRSLVHRRPEKIARKVVSTTGRPKLLPSLVGAAHR